MAGYDKTGPEGKGSKTGRGLGNCSDNKTQEKNKSVDSTRRGGGFRRRLRVWRKNGLGMMNGHRTTRGNKT